MTDPLGSGVMSDAVDDVKTLVTGTYLPIYIGAGLAGIAISVGLGWLFKGARRIGKGR